MAGGNAFDESGGGCEWNGLPVNCSTYAYALNSGYTKMIGDVPSDGRGWNPQGQPNPYVSEEEIGTKIERELWARFDNAAEYGDSLDSWQSPMWVVDAPHLGANGAMETMGSGRFVHARRRTRRDSSGKATSTHKNNLRQPLLASLYIAPYGWPNLMRYSVEFMKPSTMMRMLSGS